MKTATIQEIKQELQALPQSELSDLLLKLARAKKENKELLTFLLFEAHDIEGYIEGVKKEMETAFLDINVSHVYFAKKTIRKVLRITNKYIRFSGSKQAEAELLIHFCKLVKDSGIKIDKNPALNNLYQNQLKKIEKAMDGLHEDMQYDLQKLLAPLFPGG
jgi:predicted CopG family antitoxin